MSIDEALLIRYLQKETDESENQAIEKWRNDLPTHEQTLQNIEKLWEKTEALKPVFPAFDTDKAWAKFSLALEKAPNPEDEKEATVIDINEKRRTNGLPFRGLSFLRIAASILLVVGVGWLFYQNFRQDTPEKQYATITKTKKQTHELTLGDKSKIRLGHNAKISFPEKFAKNNRTVQFEGQAHFSITPDASRPFIIQTPEKANIKVLGTSFEVTAYPDKQDVIVQVSSGKVELSVEGKAVILEAGEVGIWAGKEYTLTKSSNKKFEQTQEIKTHSFEFKATPLREVINRLNIECNAKLELTPNLENCPLTVNFDNQYLQTIIQIIMETLELNGEVGKNGYTILKGKGCL
jgi:ferric-dicitrate binding protein FerR (iron transport regulator)